MSSSASSTSTTSSTSSFVGSITLMDSSLHLGGYHMPICDVKFAGSSNYKEWGWLMSSLFDGLGLLRHVTGDSPKPTTTDLVPRWMKNEARAKYVLFQSRCVSVALLSVRRYGLSLRSDN